MWLITTHRRPPSELTTKEIGTDFWRDFPQEKAPYVTPTAREVETNCIPSRVSAGRTLPIRVPLGAHTGFLDEDVSADKVAICPKR
jgi:hypothetical protein